MEPFLKWAGGKRWLLEATKDRSLSLRALYAPHQERRLVDLFTGAGSVVFGLAPRRAIMNDLNPHLINCLRYAQLGMSVEESGVPMVLDRDVFTKNRCRFNELARTDTFLREQAILFYYLNRTAYNGLCRFNRRGEFNAPFGKYTKVNFLNDFAEYDRAMRGWKITRRDFAQVQILPGDFLFADPPYDGDDGAFVGYWSTPFTWDDQVRLARLLSIHQGPVVATNKATQRILALYQSLGFETHLVNAPRRISCKARVSVQEMVALKGL